MWGQQDIRPLLFYQEKFNQIDSYFPHNIWPVFGVVISNQQEKSKTQKLTKICRGSRWSDHSFFTSKSLTKLSANLPNKIYVP